MRPDEIHDPAVDALLAHLDHPVPGVTVDDVVARAARAEPRRGAPWTRVAAVLAALALGVGAAWAAPGSPVPAWIEALLGGTAPGTPMDEGDVRPSDAGGERGIAVPAASVASIRVMPGPGGGWISVALHSESVVDVRSPSSTTRFTSEPGALLVEHSATDTLRVLVPRTGRVEVRVGDAILWSSEAGTVRSATPERGDGGWLFALPPGR